MWRKNSYDGPDLDRFEPQIAILDVDLPGVFELASAIRGELTPSR
jgi:hypothetical protein